MDCIGATGGGVHDSISDTEAEPGRYVRVSTKQRPHQWLSSRRQYINDILIIIIIIIIISQSSSMNYMLAFKSHLVAPSGPICKTNFLSDPCSAPAKFEKALCKSGQIRLWWGLI